MGSLLPLFLIWNLSGDCFFFLHYSDVPNNDKEKNVFLPRFICLVPIKSNLWNFPQFGNYPGKFILHWLRSQFAFLLHLPEFAGLGAELWQQNLNCEERSYCIIYFFVLYLSRQVRDFRLFKSLIREECQGFGLLGCNSFTMAMFKLSQ